MPIRQQSGRVGMIMRSRVPSLQGKQVDAFTFGHAAVGKIARMFTSIFLPRAVTAAVVLLTTASVGAVQSVLLPAWVCAHPDAIFVGGFEIGENPIPYDPSNGAGPVTLNSSTHVLHIAGLGSGTQTYYLYVPGNYTASRSWPLLLALDGVAPYATAGNYAADVRDTWASVAEAGQFIVAAPVGNEVVLVGNEYGISWLVPPTSGPSDYDLFAAVRADLENTYNIERTRIHGWGFSAGGHVMHDLGINHYSSAFNASTMAAYAVIGADLAGLACQGMTDSQCNATLAGVSRKIPVDIHIGYADQNYSHAAEDYARFSAHGWSNGQTLFFTAFNGGHTYTMAAVQEAWANLCPNAVTP